VWRIFTQGAPDASHQWIAASPETGINPYLRFPLLKSADCSDFSSDVFFVVLQPGGMVSSFEPSEADPGWGITGKEKTFGSCPRRSHCGLRRQRVFRFVKAAIL
jgi:hypothetical protein